MLLKIRTKFANYFFLIRRPIVRVAGLKRNVWFYGALQLLRSFSARTNFCQEFTDVFLFSVYFILRATVNC